MEFDTEDQVLFDVVFVIVVVLNLDIVVKATLKVVVDVDGVVVLGNIKGWSEAPCDGSWLLVGGWGGGGGVQTHFLVKPNSVELSCVEVELFLFIILRNIGMDVGAVSKTRMQDIP